MTASILAALLQDSKTTGSIRMKNLDFEQWLGRSEEVHDDLSQVHAQRTAATFNVEPPKVGEELPLLWHWCYFQSPVPTLDMGPDGHPELGSFMPPVHGYHRMWAGGRVEFKAPLFVGIPAHRNTTIHSINKKNGRTGLLLFVTLKHEYYQDEILTIIEEQDIVYRQPSPPKIGLGDAAPEADWCEEIHADPALLFRYSAVTFNTHRIHYDSNYTTRSEGYPGLVVQGPLTATLNMAAFTRAHPLARVKRFSFRGVRPLIAECIFQVRGRLTENNVAELWATNDLGIVQEAKIYFI